MVITSKENEKVKLVRSLNQKKGREKNNAYYLEGLKVTYEILESKEAINVMFIAYSSEIMSKINYGKISFEKIVKRCEENNIKMFDIKENIFEFMCDTVTPQGILCVLKKDIKSLDVEISNNIEKNIFVLDSVRDLGNIGTIIRNSAAFDIKNIICINNTADVYSPKCLRSTMGNILKVNVFYEKSLNVINYLKEKGYNIIATSLSDNSDEIKNFDFSKKCAFILGNEANGVCFQVLDLCDQKIKIEMKYDIESLNVSSASAIISYLQYINKN